MPMAVVYEKGQLDTTDNYKCTYIKSSLSENKRTN